MSGGKDPVKCIGGVLDGKTVDAQGANVWKGLKPVFLTFASFDEPEFVRDIEYETYRREVIAWKFDGMKETARRWFFILDGMSISQAMDMLMDGYRAGLTGDEKTDSGDVR